MDALVLAGGETPSELAAAGYGERALIKIADRPMLAHVLHTLRSLPAIERIAVVGHEATLSLAAQTANVTGISAQGGLVENLTAGLNELGNASVLVCTCDIPLVTPASFEELFAGAKANGLEVAYPIVRRATCEATFAEGKRTYATLRDGEFTGGNALVLPGHIVGRVSRLLEAAYQARKNPVALAKILGPGFLLKFAGKRLKIADIERKMSQILGCRAGAVEMRDAAIAFDVDKVSDLRVAEQVIKQRALETAQR